MSYITMEAPTDRADLSLARSGHSFENPIQGPERSLLILENRDLRVSSSELSLKNGITIPVKRVLSKQMIGENDDIDSLSYYLYVGHSKITAKHFQRTLIDIRDRAVKGESQQWAYVVVSMRYLDQPDPPHGAPPTREMADELLRELLLELMESNVDWWLIDN